MEHLKSSAVEDMRNPDIPLNLVVRTNAGNPIFADECWQNRCYSLVRGSRLLCHPAGAGSPHDPPACGLSTEELKKESKGIPMTQAILHTNHGDIKIQLFDDQAPKTVANFVGLANGTKEYLDPRTGKKTTGHFYDGLTFHRVIDGFMIQGGDPLGNGRGGPGYQFGDEFHPELSFDRPYLLAMANAGPGTNGSQFFITVGKAPHLNRRHTIFGEVADPTSRAVVDEIARVPTDRNDRPLDPVVINTVEIV